MESMAKTVEYLPLIKLYGLYDVASIVCCYGNLMFLTQPHAAKACLASFPLKTLH